MSRPTLQIDIPDIPEDVELRIAKEGLPYKLDQLIIATREVMSAASKVGGRGSFTDAIINEYMFLLEKEKE